MRVCEVAGLLVTHGIWVCKGIQVPRGGMVLTAPPPVWSRATPVYVCG